MPTLENPHQDWWLCTDIIGVPGRRSANAPLQAIGHCIPSTKSCPLRDTEKFNEGQPDEPEDLCE